MKENVILDKSFQFAVRIVKLSQFLVLKKKEYVLSKQIIGSGSSIGANIEEAEGGFSKKDFIAKMNLAYKEARETKYWMRLLNAADYLENDLYHSLMRDCEEILRILFSIIKTSRTN